MPFKQEGPESAITRRHIIRRNTDIAEGLVSIIGGKLTTYRSLAEQAVDKVGKILRRRLPPCRTRDSLLPGAFALDDARRALEATGLLSPEGVQRLIDVYGGRSARIVSLCESEPSLARPLGEGGRMLAAEVRFVMREEFALTLSDIVFRRMMIGLDADQARDCYEEIAALAADEAGWSPEQTRQQLEELEEYAESLRVG